MKCRRTRKEFLLSLAGAVALSQTTVAADRSRGPKVLLVVAHPDDEYECAATIYRITHELGGVVDQVVITNGEGGFHYSLLAESVYGVALTTEDVGRAKLPQIRKAETLRAGKILGIRDHYFLDQKDARFTLDVNEPFQGFWDRKYILRRLGELLEKDRYDFVFTLLPTEDTHGHHQAATVLALEAVAKFPEDRRPAVLGALAANAGEQSRAFEGRSNFPVTRLCAGSPVFVVDRLAPFGYHNALNYNIVVNWVIAEHKSQGLFQTEYGKHTEERFWLFEIGGAASQAAAKNLFSQLPFIRQ
jgi:LmbE family N-acetylglucosaminyl deacetylase